MKARHWRDILRYCGYETVQYSKYKGTCVYVKKHTRTTSTCTVIKDSHGKGQPITFAIASQRSDDPEIKRIVDLDVGFLEQEAEKIVNAFRELKKMKSPKHIWF